MPTSPNVVTGKDSRKRSTPSSPDASRRHVSVAHTLLTSAWRCPHIAGRSSPTTDTPARPKEIAMLTLKRLVASATLATFVAVGSVGTAFAADTPRTASENACVNGHWPADAQGRPASLQPGATAGLSLWHTDTGWSAFVTHPGTDKVVFTGRIVSSGHID